MIHVPDLSAVLRISRCKLFSYAQLFIKSTPAVFFILRGIQLFTFRDQLVQLLQRDAFMRSDDACRIDPVFIRRRIAAGTILDHQRGVHAVDGCREHRDLLDSLVTERFHRLRDIHMDLFFGIRLCFILIALFDVKVKQHLLRITRDILWFIVPCYRSLAPVCIRGIIEAVSLISGIVIRILEDMEYQFKMIELLFFDLRCIRNRKFHQRHDLIRRTVVILRAQCLKILADILLTMRLCDVLIVVVAVRIASGSDICILNDLILRICTATVVSRKYDTWSAAQYCRRQHGRSKQTSQ